MTFYETYNVTTMFLKELQRKSFKRTFRSGTLLQTADEFSVEPIRVTRRRINHTQLNSSDLIGQCACKSVLLCDLSLHRSHMT